MALTPTEESQTRALIAQEAPLLSLAGNEATITSKLGATKVNLSQLPAATVLADADLLLVRQGTTDKSVAASAFKTYATPAASETVVGVTRLATDAEVQAGTLRTIAVDPGSLSSRTALETRTGIAAVATQSQTNAGTDDATIVTPKKLRFGFSSNLSQNGYIVFPQWLGGVIFQWGTVSGSASYTVTFPLAFPNSVYVVLANCLGPFSTVAPAWAETANASNTSAQIFCYAPSTTAGQVVGANRGANWFSIGR